MHRFFLAAFAAGLLLSAGASCSRRHTLTRVEQGDRDGVMHIGNFAEPRELDPQLATGIPEVNILYALGEGLVTADGHDLHPTPGVAESWEVSPDGMTYTFHLHADAKWSNGEPLTAPDFVASYRRVLDPKLGAELAFYVWPLKNAEAYNKGKLTDFDQVGVHAPDAHTLRLDLEHPTPYLLRLIVQRMWFPVYLPAIGENRRAQRPFQPGLDPAGQLRRQRPLRPDRLAAQPADRRKKEPALLERRAHPAQRGALLSHRRRQHRGKRLPHRPPAQDLQRQSPRLQDRPLPARSPRVFPHHAVPGHLLLHVQHDAAAARRRARAPRAGHEHRPREHRQERPARRPVAQRLLSPRRTPPVTPAARRFPMIPPQPGSSSPTPGTRAARACRRWRSCSTPASNTRQVAEAIQQMWKRELGVDVNLSNQEWKVYLNSRRMGSYTITRAGWIGSLDPSFFLENMLTGGDNNQTGFASPEYDRLIQAARDELDPVKRYDDFQRAEAILLDAAPVAPVYSYTNFYLLRPSVRGWSDNLIDYHPYADLSLQP